MTKEEDGVEIKIQPDGAKHWYLHGVLHRDDGPAVERPHGEKWWFQFGKEHREDGPAIERADGSKEWFRNGKHHREDGPATESADGRTNRYYLHGKEWEDGASIIARRKAEKTAPRKYRAARAPSKSLNGVASENGKNHTLRGLLRPERGRRRFRLPP